MQPDNHVTYRLKILPGQSENKNHCYRISLQHICIDPCHSDQSVASHAVAAHAVVVEPYGFKIGLVANTRHGFAFLSIAQSIA